MGIAGHCAFPNSNVTVTCLSWPIYGSLYSGLTNEYFWIQYIVMSSLNFSAYII